MPPRYIVATEAPERCAAGDSGRAPYQHLRVKSLTPDEQAAIAAAAESGRSLRSLAAELGVSQVTVRTAYGGGSRPAFHAFVEALLERGELDEAEIRALWKRAGREAA
jgi:hypothetical protein